MDDSYYCRGLLVRIYYRFIYISLALALILIVNQCLPIYIWCKFYPNDGNEYVHILMIAYIQFFITLNYYSYTYTLWLKCPQKALEVL